MLGYLEDETNELRVEHNRKDIKSLKKVVTATDH